MARGFKITARGVGDLKTRYRPQRFSEIVPTFPMKEAVAILENPNASQVYLFEGLTGSGKTTLARIIARAVCCKAEGDVEKPCLECDACQTMERQPDYTEINVANFRGVDAVRNKIAGMMYLGTYLKRKVYVFDEAHQLTPQAQELMNKVLEEPIGDTLIFLCTTNKKGLKRTLLGRCFKINFKRMTKAQMKKVVKQVCEDANQDMPDEATMADLHMRADGSVRDLLNLMEKVLLGSYTTGSDFEDESVHEGAPNIFALVNGLKDKEWPVVREILATDNVKNDPDGYRETICVFLARQALKGQLDLKIAAVLGHLGGSLWNEPKREQHSLLVLRCMRACYKK